MWLIDDLLSLNDDSIIEKHYKDIYPTELKLESKNGELFDKRDNFGFSILRMLFYCSNIPSKMFYGCIGAEFLRIFRATSKIEDLSHICKLLLSRMLKRSEQLSGQIIKMIQQHQEVFIKYNKSIEEVMQAIGF